MIEVRFKPLRPFINKGHWWEQEGMVWGRGSEPEAWSDRSRGR